MYCRDCGAGLDVTGAAVRPAFCTSCAYELALSWRYCPRCGNETPVADRERSTRLTVETPESIETASRFEGRASLIPEVVEPPEVELISRGWNPDETEWVEVSEPDVVVALPEDEDGDPDVRPRPRSIPVTPHPIRVRPVVPSRPAGTGTRLILLGAGLVALTAVVAIIVLNRLLVSFADGAAAASDVDRLDRFLTTWLEAAVVPVFVLAVILLLRWRRRNGSRRTPDDPLTIPVAAGSRWTALLGLAGGGAITSMGRMLPRTTVGEAIDANTWIVIGLGLLILGCLAGVRIVAALPAPPPPDESVP